ncbi:uncharacterized protein EI97DRAFT_440252 [Westerdykella ornata]|uniref:Uncharacterized protein n=1 Tax=Westerdykella ornata TaxID=318751 RepID=A0A6A6JR51_WESOR|nr:uncharacterized protein EI97DRAFT_440252 [Westerdykella ornata]KAF2278724.1 hypothetical protein EI97DRAFT_440252 [Westerdykella ornata]
MAAMLSQAKPCPAMRCSCESRIIVILGLKDKKGYTICRKLPCTSTYLKEAIAAWKGPNPPVVEIRWSNEQTFQTYHHWLLTREVRTNNDRNGTTQNATAYYNDLIKCGTFGDLIKDNLFQDMIMSAFTGRLRQPSGDQYCFIAALTMETLKLVYDTVLPGSPLRQIIPDVVGRFATVASFESMKKATGLPRDFIIDSMVAAVKERDRLKAALKETSECAIEPAKRVRFKGEIPQPQGFAPNECVYHLHNKDGQPCWRVQLHTW